MTFLRNSLTVSKIIEIFSKKTGHWASDEKEFALWLLERLNAAAMPNGNTFEKCVSPERGA